MKFISNTLGGILSPLDSFLLMRGMKTLCVRMDRHQQNAQKIAEYLDAHNAAAKVYYPGLSSHRNYELQKSQAKGSGAVISFTFNEEDYDMKTFVDNLTLFGFAVSLGGVESLICRPATMTHESYSDELQKEIGITKNLLRLAIGIEDVEDLIADLDQAFAKAKRA
jgi:cystathionine beta-lyase